MRSLKQKIKTFFYSHGYEASYRGVSRIEHLDGIGRRLRKSDAKIVFDVGANKGQTLHYLYPFFDKAHFYCFEPDPRTYEQLQLVSKGLNRVTTLNVALGSSMGTTTLYANEASEGNSLLRVSRVISQNGAPAWLKQEGEKEVTVISLDGFCQEHRIESIDLLKMDTQGFEAHILKGATEMLNQKAITMIFCEVLFSEYYEDQDYFDDVYSILKTRGYKLVDFYQKFWGDDGALTACDALFIR